MNNVLLKLKNIVGISKELFPVNYIQPNAFTQVGTFDLTDGSDSDTRMGAQYYGGGARIVYYTSEGATATIDFVCGSLIDVPCLETEVGKKYVVKFYIPNYSVDDETINGVTATIYLGATNIGTNALSATNRSGFIEGIVTCSTAGELHISGYSDYSGSFSIGYISVTEYDENQIYDTIDLYDDERFPLTFQVDDIANPEKRKTNFSKSIVVPGTKNNNIIFNNIFEIDVSSSFNPNKKLDVVVYSNTFEVFNGVLKLDKIRLNDKQMIEYEITLLSNITDIFLLLGDSELSDLDFSEYNHTFNAGEQVSSWGPQYSASGIKKFGANYQNFYLVGPNANKPKGEGYLYCLMNNGFVSMLDTTYNGVSLTGPTARVEDIFPGIYLREYLSKMFRSINKRWTSTLFDSIHFRKLVIPYNDVKIELTTAQINARKFNALSNPEYQTITFETASVGYPNIEVVKYNNITTGGAFDNTGTFDNSGDGVWYVSKGGTYNFNANISFIWQFAGLKNFDGSAPDVSNPVFCNFTGEHKIKIIRISNGITSTLAENNIDMPNDVTPITSATGSTSAITGSVSASSIQLIQGDLIYVTIEAKQILQTDFNNDIEGVAVTPQGLFYQVTSPALTPVLNILDNSPEFGNQPGDRYIIRNPNSLDDWYGKEGQIATKNSGAGWSYEDPPIYSQVTLLNFTINGYTAYYIRNGSSGFNWILTGTSYYSYFPTYYRPTSGVIWENYTPAIKASNGGTATLVINPTASAFNNDVVNNGITDGSNIDLNSAIPKGVKQRDLFDSVLKMYNCFMVSDPEDENNIIIETANDFYSNDVIDTWKFDLEKPIEIVPLSELEAKQYNFAHQPDEDYINKHFQKYYAVEGLPFGSFIAKYDNDFIDGKKEVRTIFSPTPVYRAYEQKSALPSILSDTDYKPIKSNIRLLYYNGAEIREPSFNHIYDGGVSISPRYIPSLNMWDDMFDPTNSLVWQNSGATYYYRSVAPNYTYNLTLTANTLYNKYYSSYVKNITDKDSKLIRANIKLSMVDINNLDFSKLYFIDGHWLRLYKVLNYDPLSEETTTCEFLRYNEGRAFTGTYSTGLLVSGGFGYNDANWIVENDLNLTRLPEDTTRDLTPVYSLGSVGGEEVLAQRAIGSNNYIAPTSERIMISGDNNIVYDYAQRISIINSDNVVIASNVKNVSVVDTNNITITESNVSYISGVKFTNSEIIESNPGNFSVIDGGHDILLREYGSTTINVIDGGLDSTREYGSDSEFDSVDGGFN